MRRNSLAQEPVFIAVKWLRLPYFSQLQPSVLETAAPIFGEQAKIETKRIGLSVQNERFHSSFHSKHKKKKAQTKPWNCNLIMQGLCFFIVPRPNGTLIISFELLTVKS